MRDRRFVGAGPLVCVLVVNVAISLVVAGPAHAYSTPDILVSVTGQLSSGTDGGVIPTYVLPIGGTGDSAPRWTQTITHDAGSISASGRVQNGVFSGRVNGTLDFTPTAGFDSLGAEITVSVYVRGVSKCFTVECSSSGTLLVAHPGGCSSSIGPFAEAAWNGQSVGSLDLCLPDLVQSIESDSCSESGTSCCTPVSFPDIPGGEYSLAFTKTFVARLAQETLPGAPGTRSIEATLDVEFSVTASLCDPTPECLRVLTFSATRAGSCSTVDWSFLTGKAFADARGAVLDPANFGPGGTVPSAIMFEPPVDSLTVPALENADIVFISEPVILSECERVLLDRFIAAGGGCVVFQNAADQNVGSIFGALAGDVGGACGEVSDPSSPIVNGPFGAVAGCIVPQYHRYFSDVGPQGSVFLSDGSPVGASFIHGEGRAVLICDEEWLMNVTEPGCAIGSGGPDPNRLFMNAVSWVAPERTLSIQLFDCGFRVLGPDLAVLEVDASAISTDCQTLETTGIVKVTIRNAGDTAPPSLPSVKCFEDRNGNRTFEPGEDLLLAESSVPTFLQPGQEVELSLPISAQLRFAGSPVFVCVDAENVIAEIDEANNFGDSGAGCEFQPVPGAFEPVLEWSWTSSPVQPTALNVMSAPCVIDLDGDGSPEIVFVSGTLHEAQGYLRVLRGSDGSEVFTTMIPGLQLRSGVAVGNLDDDPHPEIVVTLAGLNRIVVLEHDGSQKWTSPQLEPLQWGVPSIADLNQDGKAEIIMGRQVLSGQTGVVLWSGVGGRGEGGIGPISASADLDLDGIPEVVAGNTTYSANGQVFWQSPAPDGLTGVGNFDEDLFPEIVLVSSGNVRLLEHDGTIKWGPIAIPGGGRGGPPTIADFDGDGEPEIGVAGSTRYVVFETNGSIKWQSVTRDGSSNITGSSVFDFEGDGAAEVIYQDETRLRVYRGVDGSILFETARSSGTAQEYPLVADVDADGNAEIVSIGNTVNGFGPDHGIYVYGDAPNNWVATRRIWNQHTYHITNVNDDGSIPQFESNNWLYPPAKPLNNYRQNLLTSASPLAAADLTASYLRFDGTGCTDSLVITARVGNGGSNVAPRGVNVAFFNGDVGASSVLLIGVMQTSRPLDPGEYEDVSFTFYLPLAGEHRIFVRADDDGTGVGRVNECNEDNNLCSAFVSVGLKPSCVLRALEEPECGSSGNTLCVDNAAGDIADFWWSVIADSGVTGWSITAGQGTECIEFSAGEASDSVTIRLVVETVEGCFDSCEVRVACVEAVDEGSRCTLSQGGWGNTRGRFNDERRLDTVNRLITPEAPVVVGIPVAEDPASFGSIRFTDGEESCIAVLLPAGGVARTFLPMLGDISPSFANDCDVSPERVRQNRFDNVLVGQTLALVLNTRLDTGLLAVRLDELEQTYGIHPGPDGFRGTEDDECLVDDVHGVHIDESILVAMEEIGLPLTVQGLIELANRTLSGLSTGGATPAAVSDACTAINEGFHECRCLEVPEIALADSARSGVGDPVPPLPTAFGLSQNIPNPFSRTTSINFAAPERSEITITVYNVLGQRVHSLRDGEHPAGYHSVPWEGRTDSGGLLSSGIYFVRMEARSLETGQVSVETRRVVISR